MKIRWVIPVFLSLLAISAFGQSLQVKIISEPQVTTVGNCSGAIVLELQKRNGDPRASDGSVSIWPIVSGVPFFRDSECSEWATQFDILSGETQVSLYFQSDVVGEFLFEYASSVGVNDSQIETVLAESAPDPGNEEPTVPVTMASQISIVSSSQTVLAGTCSGAIAVQLQDEQGNVATRAETVSIWPVVDGVAFFRDAQCSEWATQFDIAVGESQTELYFMTDTLGEFLFSFVSNIGASDEQTQTVVSSDQGTDPTPEPEPTPSDPPPSDPGSGGDNPMGFMPYVDESQIPIGEAGSLERRVQYTDQVPGPSNDGIGAFRTVCEFSHMNFDDPIVSPGVVRSTHLHAFFGNSLADAFSTAESLRNTGASTCRGGIANRSAYWVPAVIDAQGVPQRPVRMHVYYKSGYLGVPASAINPFPRGLRMIAGNARSSVEQEHVWWGCSESYVGNPRSMYQCPAGQMIEMVVRFPQCWNGVDLDSEDHKSHMSYPVDGICPPTHPVAIPTISFVVQYEQPNGIDGWRLSSDMYDPNLNPPGLSGHGDWFEGWDEEVADQFVRECVQSGNDCFSNLIGPNQTIY